MLRSKPSTINLFHVIKDFAIIVYAFIKIRHETYSPKWRDAVHSIYEHPDTAANDDPITRNSLTFIKDHKDSIMRLLNIADTLSVTIETKDTDFVLCHSGIHADHVLI